MAYEGQGVLLEDINHKLDAILEGQAAMSDVPARLTSIDDRLMNVESRLGAVEAAVKDLSNEARGHEARIADLESQAA